MFTKRHYQRIAQLLKDTKPIATFQHPDAQQGAIDAWNSTVESFAMMFESDSPRKFNKARFLSACGYND